VAVLPRELAGAARLENSLWVQRNHGETEAVLTKVFGGRGSDGGRPTMEKHSSGASPSTTRQREHREVEEMTPR
jgi:hypothetical protein